MQKDLVLQIKDLTFFYKKDNPIYDNFSLELKKGELVTIFGKSGTGKTTLFELILGSLNPIRGTIKKSNISMIFQDPYNSFHPTYTIFEQIKDVIKKEEITNFPNMYSCGTSTAESVPCMFSIFGKADYDYKKGISTENILDVLKHTNDIKILWRDNNSDSKGVALRVDFEDYRTSKTNTICDEECRDEGMIVGLDEYIKNKDS